MQRPVLLHPGRGSLGDTEYLLLRAQIKTKCVRDPSKRIT